MQHLKIQVAEHVLGINQSHTSHHQLLHVTSYVAGLKPSQQVVRPHPANISPHQRTANKPSHSVRRNAVELHLMPSFSKCCCMRIDL